MRTVFSSALVLLIGSIFVGTAGAVDPPHDEAVYVEKETYPVIEELEGIHENLVKAAEAETVEILAAYHAAEMERTEPAMKLRFDLSGVEKPTGPEQFIGTAWHFPPTPQYLTGTCWSFSATSFMESEIKRLHGEEIKLSEMWTAYWEFVAKTRGFVASRGESLVDHGSQSAAVLRVFAERGVVPRSAYEGAIGQDLRFNHDLMLERVNSFLGWCKETNFWDEETVVVMVRRLLDATMGRPPESVSWEGGEISPQDFLSRVCRLNPADYVSVMSTLSQPIWALGEYAVPDNWWHDASYVNVPLDAWYGVILKGLDGGHSMVIGGDVSEPGMNGFEDVAVIPSFDIPGELIDQSARELRFDNGTTTDDHGIHLVGRTQIGDHDWFLIKDSNRSSRQGEHDGYYFYRDDYVRLKMLTITVHRDLIEDILEQVGG